jgi:steroid delta-isomerase-like uncharacterized protein
MCTARVPTGALNEGDPSQSQEGTSPVNEKNADTIKRHFEYELVGDTPAVLTDMVGPYEYRIPGISNETLIGEDAIAGVHKMLFEAFAPLEIQLVSLHASETIGIAEVLVGGVQVGEFDGVPGSGRRILFNTCAVFKFSEGKILSETVYFDRREFLRQAGYTETITPAEDI